MTPHFEQEWLNIIHRSWIHEFAIVEPQANPQVVHQDWEASDDGCDTPWTTELETAWYINIEVTKAKRRVRTFRVGPDVCRQLFLPQL